jgi:mono/diheme cytochrome c family protein
MNIKLSLFKQITLVAFFGVGLSCSSDNRGSQENTTTTTTAPQQTEQASPESGVGPFQNVQLNSELDMALVEKGRELFEGRCIACHQFENRYVGPPLGGVTERRNPNWVMNMIINPTEMLQQDPIAKELLAEYMTPMVNMNVNEEDTRAIFEYLRAHDKGEVEAP